MRDGDAIGAQTANRTRGCVAGRPTPLGSPPRSAARQDCRVVRDFPIRLSCPAISSVLVAERLGMPEKIKGIWGAARLIDDTQAGKPRPDHAAHATAEGFEQSVRAGF